MDVEGTCAALSNATNTVRPDGTVVQCVVENLEEFTEYHFRAFEVCEATPRNSPYLTSGMQSTYRRRVDPPTIHPIEEFTSDAIPNIKPNSIGISWSAAAPTCDEAGSSFGSWDVEYARTRLSGAEQWIQSDSCAGQTNRSVTNCVVDGLAHSTEYSFRVYELCSTAVVGFDVSSSYSIATSPNSTSLLGPSPPSDVDSSLYKTENDTRTNVSMALHWVASISQCSDGSADFSRFETAGHISDSATYRGKIEYIDPPRNGNTSDSFGNVTYSGELTVSIGDHVQIVGSSHQPYNAEWRVLAVYSAEKKFAIYLRMSIDNGYDDTLQPAQDFDDKVKVDRAQFAKETESFSDGMVLKWDAISGCNVTDRAAQYCNASGLTPNSRYVFRSRERCNQPQATSYWSFDSPVLRTLASHALPPLVSSKFTCLDCKGNNLEVTLGPDDSSCDTSKTIFQSWNIQYAINSSAPVWQDATPSRDRIDEDLSEYGKLLFNVENLTNGKAYIFRARETCADGRDLDGLVAQGRVVRG